MKIENSLLNISMPQSDRVQEPSTGVSQSSSRARAPEAGSDGVELGSQAGFVKTTQTAGLAERENRVQTLRALIQSGQYQVDSAALSESIVTATLSGY
jgi:flagellar biosynthesis anti-sigma factor FlgM